MATFYRSLKVRLNRSETLHQLSPLLGDNFPDVVDVLRRHPRPNANTDSSKENSATTLNAPTILPRPSLRATTFEGKTIFIKRRTRTIAPLVRVP